MSNRLGVEVISCRIGEPEPLPPLPVNKQNKHTHTIYMQYIYTHIYMYTLYLYSLYTQYSSVAQSRLTLHHMDCSTPGFPVRHQLPSLLKLLSMKLVIPSNHLILCCLLLLLSSIFPSIRVFSSDSVLHIRWPKYWSFSLSISPFNEYSGLISLRMHRWISLQSKGLSESFPTPQFKSINASVLRSLFGPTLIHDHWKNHSLD